MLRIEELRLSALTVAEKVKKSRIPFEFNPMNSRERRIIHLALRNEPEVRSESAGMGPYRQVVVYPAGMPSAPVKIPSATAAVPQTERPPLESCKSHRHDRSDFHSSGTWRVGNRASLGQRRAPDSRRHSAVPQNARVASWSASLADLVDAEGNVIDHVVVTFFEAPRSYTAEDVVEIACHGSPVVLRHCLERACAAGARLAEPGEFTLRAYLNGRIDLPQAEAVRDLIEATTLYQARVAAQQVEGSVSRRIAPLKEQLLELISLLEAGIDFAEDDISVAPAEEILRRLEPISRTWMRWCSSFRIRQAGAFRFHAGDCRAAECRARAACSTA